MYGSLGLHKGLCKLRLRVQYLVDMLVFRRCGLFGAKEEECGARNPSLDSCTLLSFVGERFSFSMKKGD